MMTYGDFKRHGAPNTAGDWVAWALRLVIALMLGFLVAEFQGMKKEMKALKNSQHRLEIGIASNYATNAEVERIVQSLSARLNRHEDRLHINR